MAAAVERNQKEQMKNKHPLVASAPAVAVQRFVRPRLEWYKSALDGIKPKLSDGVKEMVMGWLASEKTETLFHVQHTEPDLRQPKQVPTALDQAGSELSRRHLELPLSQQHPQRTLAEFCIRISYNDLWSNVSSSPTAGGGIGGAQSKESK